MRGAAAAKRGATAGDYNGKGILASSPPRQVSVDHLKRITVQKIFKDPAVGPSKPRVFSKMQFFGVSQFPKPFAALFSHTSTSKPPPPPHLPHPTTPPTSKPKYPWKPPHPPTLIIKMQISCLHNRIKISIMIVLQLDFKYIISYTKILISYKARGFFR